MKNFSSLLTFFLLSGGMLGFAFSFRRFFPCICFDLDRLYNLSVRAARVSLVEGVLFFSRFSFHKISNFMFLLDS